MEARFSFILFNLFLFGRVFVSVLCELVFREKQAQGNGAAFLGFERMKNGPQLDVTAEGHMQRPPGRREAKRGGH